MPVTKKPKKLSIKDYTMFDFILMTPENAGKVLVGECKKKRLNIEVINNILEFSPVDINWQDENGNTALIWASFWGHTEIVQMLLERPEIRVNLQSEYGRTALMFASIEGHTKVVSMLLDRPEIRVNLQDKWGETALWYATKNGRTEIVKMLREHSK